MEKMMTAYSNKQNAVRAARKALGVQAKLSADFSLTEESGQWTWADIERPAVEKKGRGKAAALVTRACSPEGITNAEIRELTGWTKIGGFFGAMKRRGLTLTRRREGDDTRWFASAQ